jgi:hypothetical protein
LKDRVISYLAAVFLNLALVWSDLPAIRGSRLARPAIVHLFSGARVTAVSGPGDDAGVRIGLLLDERLWLSLIDPQSRLFPGTLRCAGLEAPVAVLN